MSVFSSSEPVTSPLGKVSEYPDRYDPTLLFPIERAGNRGPLGIEDSALPFIGADEWQAFELSWLNARGKPVVAIARFSVPAHSPRLIESKSWKLYLNSFNQTRFGSTVEVRECLERDLSHAASEEVGVALFGVDDALMAPGALPGVCLDELDIEVANYEPDAGLIRTVPDYAEETLYSHLLKSNCPVTGQPDWGSVLIQYRGPALDHEALLAYLISYRSKQEFHEHCVESIFMDLMTHAAPESLLVMARYVRRGGLDISPWRATQGHPAPELIRLVRQ
ncbi:NADPH-dependent 7-cyano-7-deazaguanine reductase QueF [Larsenimonas suaedae]|uniref:NADPH-dependent 7-cyano-7-deazaguanine reductase n=1 Tax=Larsenimonas suaedae TaxID=1851019 RepID=A0ABU1GZE1_9GAMM|nr:NADPH-dependent 7-cyano-7-deazaguanine reductase QueF [Larsenimonas suaedae]MCM2972798.1 NADPH-dependent 7-cyano-7-deazaguanine reductase QueF [Larsenimonas suaedae]MDR5896897.1 NADPH-dependent 7-cyano-7-deazaguanine reductase QueF [Larsenimonas suaedae]